MKQFFLPFLFCIFIILSLFWFPFRRSLFFKLFSSSSDFCHAPGSNETRFYRNNWRRNCFCYFFPLSNPLELPLFKYCSNCHAIEKEWKFALRAAAKFEMKIGCSSAHGKYLNRFGKRDKFCAWRNLQGENNVSNCITPLEWHFFRPLPRDVLCQKS